MELPKLQPHHICTDYLEGLIHVFPNYDTGDDAGKYCIGGFAIELYSGLLDERQGNFLGLCWRLVFLARHDKGKLANATVVSSGIWDKLNKRVDEKLCFMLMPLYKVEGKHRLLFVADLRDRCYMVYDSATSLVDEHREAIVQSAERFKSIYCKTCQSAVHSWVLAFDTLL